ncbi:MAG: hypothetical protein ACRC6E_10615 [Fusobacteriaceae bacterium]
MNSFIILKASPDADLSFVHISDERLQGVFKNWEKFHTITEEEHKKLLNEMNSCEWNLKHDVVDGIVTKVRKYTDEEETVILAKQESDKEIAFFNSEKVIALRIEEDYRLELEDITEAEFIEVKLYIKALNPNNLAKLTIPKRPSIFDRYN